MGRRDGLEPPPDNKARVDAANRKMWAQHQQTRTTESKAQREVKEKRDAERERQANHRLNRTAQAERDEVQKRAAVERNRACKDMARKRKEAKQAAADAAAHGGR